MLYGYVRVSTEKQTVENQKLSIANYIKNKNRNNTNVERVSETLLFDMFGFAACRTTDKKSSVNSIWRKSKHEYCRMNDV